MENNKEENEIKCGSCWAYYLDRPSYIHSCDPLMKRLVAEKHKREAIGEKPHWKYCTCIECPNACTIATPPTTNQSEQKPCSCPKGGKYERENGSYYDCDKCGGTEYITAPKPQPNVSGILERYRKEFGFITEITLTGDDRKALLEATEIYFRKEVTELLESLKMEDTPKTSLSEFGEGYEYGYNELVGKINQNLEEKLK